MKRRQLTSPLNEGCLLALSETQPLDRAMVDPWAIASKQPNPLSSDEASQSNPLKSGVESANSLNFKRTNPSNRLFEAGSSEHFASASSF